MTEQQVEVIVQRPNQADRRLVLGVGVTHLGRAEDNELVLADIGVSRRHARVTIDANSVLVEDMGSGNGTYFRGQRLDRQLLQDGDQIYVDPFTLVFRITRRTAPRSLNTDPTPRVEAPVVTTPKPPTIAPAQLVTLAGHRLNPAYPLRDGTLTLGRSEGRDITLFDPSTSRLQTSITWRDGGWWAMDEKSANGTYVNGERIDEHRLVNGDVLRLGSTEFRFESADRSPAPPPAARAVEAPRVPEPVRAIDKMLLEPTHMNPVVAPPSVEIPAPPVTTEPRPVATTTPPPPRLPTRSRLLVPIALFGFAGASLIVATAAFWYALHLPGRAVAPDASAAAPVVASPPSPEVEALMSEGRARLEQGRYLDALAQFHQAHKVAPDYDEAQRMAYLACTLRTVDAMRAPLVAPAPPPRR